MERGEKRPEYSGSAFSPPLLVSRGGWGVRLMISATDIEKAWKFV